ncbi:glutamate racemase [bacterium]|nr:glutamate racemase [bacterium]NCQ55518.1 glutamate racemase [Candidatus Parcubacteria bacterium]NCS67529.1 glutamate racemase [Candidatus Peregrinibacteria bacterium]NCS96306.1 glutamate racemase [bacterium]
MKIGVFDSGLGGHFTLDKCKPLMPEHEFIGFFDQTNAPYGDKSQAEILQLTESGVNELFAEDCDLVLIACNTACTQALRRLQEKYPDRKILGCLIPAAEMAVDSEAISIGLIGTSRTIESKKYERETFKINPRAKIHGLATPKLVPFIEAGNSDDLECEIYLKEKIQMLINEHQIKTLILGCTHYSVLKARVTKLFPTLEVIDSAEAQALKLVGYLMRHPELK